MGEYPVEIATSSRILAISDYVANLHEQCATFFALYRTLLSIIFSNHSTALPLIYFTVLTDDCQNSRISIQF